ncbi:MAG: hypothetical protein KF745_07015 [Phycisphaeraceae bacterium]|nr:hypothetical protein [Phycisphaeraceae bacterium]
MSKATTLLIAACAAVVAGASGARGQSDFVNWESPHVHPIDLTPDRGLLLAVNTADNRLEVFDVTRSGPPVKAGSVSVGLDPVSVRARSNTEAWVVNHISDSVSIVDLTTMRVVRTLAAGDEPCDVVFAGKRAFVSASQLNQVLVFSLVSPQSPPTVVAIAGEDPRALATDGTRVYAAVFESGNGTTILGQSVVSGAANPYPGRPNPPPNAGTLFSPPMSAGLPSAPPVGLIVKKVGGQWVDDNGHAWTGAVTWDLHDHDVAIIDAASLSVTYATGLMNANMAIAAGPAGQVTVVGTDATNHIRFEPNVQGTFVRSVMARFNPASPGAVSITDLNPHLTYATASIPEPMRNLSVADPRAVVWNAGGTRGYVAGMGSNDVSVFDGSGARVGQVQDVAFGPTGLVLDESRARLYVIGKFGATVAVVDTASLTLSHVTPFYDPTPASISTGRQYFYGAHLTSGLGQAGCAACHIDGRTDHLAWDLGNPAGTVKPFNQNCNGGLGGLGTCEDWHPMKGPMTTQTLVGITGTEPLHWRGDREDLGMFNAAFMSLQGRSAPLEPGQISAVEDFVASLTPPPNPNRNLDGSLKTSLGNGNPANGAVLFQTVPFDGGVLTCVSCHALPTGSSPIVISGQALLESQSMKVPQLRNMHEKSGFSRSPQSNRGFGFIHDGSSATLVEFLQSPVFRFATDPSVALQQRRDLEAFMFSFSTQTHAAVGAQTTVESPSPPAPQQALLGSMISMAQSQAVGLVVKGRVGGIVRGYVYSNIGGGAFRPDRNSEATLSPAQLLSLAGPGSELTYTVVPAGSEVRIGIDRDSDGFFDRTEMDVCADPANENSYPGDPRNPDRNGDGAITPTDIAVFINLWTQSVSSGLLSADYDGSGTVDPVDIAAFINAWLGALRGMCG